MNQTIHMCEEGSVLQDPQISMTCHTAHHMYLQFNKHAIILEHVCMLCFNNVILCTTYIVSKQVCCPCLHLIDAFSSITIHQFNEHVFLIRMTNNTQKILMLLMSHEQHLTKIKPITFSIL